MSNAILLNNESKSSEGAEIQEFLGRLESDMDKHNIQDNTLVLIQLSEYTDDNGRLDVEAMKADMPDDVRAVFEAQFPGSTDEVGSLIGDSLGQNTSVYPDEGASVISIAFVGSDANQTATAIHEAYHHVENVIDHQKADEEQDIHDHESFGMGEIGASTYALIDEIKSGDYDSEAARLQEIENYQAGVMFVLDGFADNKNDVLNDHESGHYLAGTAAQIEILQSPNQFAALKEMDTIEVAQHLENTLDYDSGKQVFEDLRNMHSAMNAMAPEDRAEFYQKVIESDGQPFEHQFIINGEEVTREVTYDVSDSTEVLLQAYVEQAERQERELQLQEEQQLQQEQAQRLDQQETLEAMNAGGALEAIETNDSSIVVDLNNQPGVDVENAPDPDTQTVPQPQQPAVDPMMDPMLQGPSMNMKGG